jgi:hypothetical protein
MKRRSAVTSILFISCVCAMVLFGCAPQPNLTPPTPLPAPGGATAIGRIVLGYGDHSPVAGLPLWLGKESRGQPVTRTNANGEFTLANLPVGQVIDVVDDHLTFQIVVTSGGIIDLGMIEYPLIHPPTGTEPTL